MYEDSVTLREENLNNEGYPVDDAQEIEEVNVFTIEEVVWKRLFKKVWSVIQLDL